MAVHVPLSPEAQLEARVLMMSTNNILSPANGKPIIVPSQDIVLGIYYLTYSREGERGEGMAFSDIGEVQKALDAGAVSLHAAITCRRSGENGADPVRVETTPGRLILSEVLPENANVRFEAINQLLTKRELSAVFDSVYRHCGQKETVIFADQVMNLGFRYATRAGISFGKDDMVVPRDKAKLVEFADREVSRYERQYSDGLITQGEKYNKVIDAWSQCTDKVATAMMQGMSDLTVGEDRRAGAAINSIYIMADSGARGSEAQMKQLAGMRGLMAKPSGEIIETPIKSNFKEGLTVLEYFNSTHGARKGLADTALKTANSGYLTRRLVDVAQDCIIVEDDCGTTNGLTVKAVIEGGETIATLGERALGRVAAEPVLDPLSGETIVNAGEVIEERGVDAIERANIEAVKIRSVLTCDSEDGVCSLCYGRDLARGTLANIGEAVGVIAAQSIGEPGTQLTMRTFHIGGAAQRGAEQSSVEAPLDATVEVENENVVSDSTGTPVVMGRNLEVVLRDEAGRERARNRIPYGAKLYVSQGETIQRGHTVASWDPFTLPLISERAGVVSFSDMVEGLSFREVVDERTGVSNKVVVDWRQQPRGSDLKPRVGSPTRAARSSRSPTAARRSTSSRWTRSSTSRTVRPSTPATCSPASRGNRPRRATLPAACRAWPSCSRRASPRITRSLPTSPAGSSSARTTRPSGGSSWCRTTATASRSSTSSPRASTSAFRKGTSCARATRSWTGTAPRTTSCVCSASRRSPPT